jgi:hypothetical protein
VVITLHGKVKGKHRTHYYLIPSVLMSKTGVQVEEALKQLINLKEATGFIDGPAILDESSIIYSTQVINDCLHKVLEDWFINNWELFTPILNTKKELRKH